MRRYSAEEKQQALARAAEIGVAKTGEEMGIAIQTLYKWRNEEKQAASTQDGLKVQPAASAVDRAEIKKLIKSNDMYEAKIKTLEEENTQLRQSIAKLKRALMDLI